MSFSGARCGLWVTLGAELLGDEMGRWMKVREPLGLRARVVWVAVTLRPVAGAAVFACGGLFLVGGGCATRALDPGVLDARTEWAFGDGVRGEALQAQADGLGLQVAEGATPPAEPRAAGTGDHGSEELDLDRCLRFGLYSSARLRAAYGRFRAAALRIPQVGTLPDPVFTFVQFVDEIETRTGPQRRRYSLSQTFPWFGTLDTRQKIALASTEASWQLVVAERLAVERAIRDAFYEYAYLGESTRITADVLQLLRQLEPVVQRGIASGTAGQAELLRLQVEVGRVENELRSLRRVQPAMSARLIAAMHGTEGRLLPLPRLAEPDLRDGPLEIAAVVRDIEASSPILRRLAAEVDRLAGAKQLAELQSWPDVTLGVDYIETAAPLMPVPGDGDDPFGVRISFRLPIYGSKYRAARQEAEFELAAAADSLADRRKELRAELEHLVFRLDDAARQLVLYRDTLLPRAQESLEVSRASYRGGRTSLLELIDSERTLLEFETGLYRACRDHHQVAAELDELVGTTVGGVQ